jgi:hypothetical protein
MLSPQRIAKRSGVYVTARGGTSQFGLVFEAEQSNPRSTALSGPRKTPCHEWRNIQRSIQPKPSPIRPPWHSRQSAPTFSYRRQTRLVHHDHHHVLRCCCCLVRVLGPRLRHFSAAVRHLSWRMFRLYVLPSPTAWDRLLVPAGFLIRVSVADRR